MGACVESYPFSSSSVVRSFVVCGVCLWLTALPSQGERTQAEVMDYLCVCGNRVAINVTQVWLTYHCLIAWIITAAFELIGEN